MIVMGMMSVSVVVTVMVLFFMLNFINGSLCTFFQSLKFHHRGSFCRQIPYWMRWLILDKLRRLLCMKLPYARRSSMLTHVDNNMSTIETTNSLLSLRMSTINNANDEHYELDTRIFEQQTNLCCILDDSSRSALSAFHEQLSHTIQVLSSRRERDDEYKTIANENRQLVQVIDRLLFWLLLLSTIVITLLLLIVIPFVLQSHEIDRLDE